MRNIFSKLGVHFSPIIFLTVLITFTVSLFLFYAVPAIRYSDIVEPLIKDVDPQTVYDEIVKNPEGYVFLDVRPGDVYEKLHAVYSKSQPLHTLYVERHTLPKNVNGKTIVLICSGGLASGVGYGYLEHFGFRNIVRIEGGIESWKAAGLPVEGTDVLR